MCFLSLKSCFGSITTMRLLPQSSLCSTVLRNTVWIEKENSDLGSFWFFVFWFIAIVSLLFSVEYLVSFYFLCFVPPMTDGQVGKGDVKAKHEVFV